MKISKNIMTELKRVSLLLMALIMIICQAAAGAYAKDTSQSYSFDVKVNSSESWGAFEPGDKVNVTVTLSRNDSGSSSFTMYAVQYDLLFDTRYFTLDESSMSAPKGQVFTTNMDKNGKWSGYQRITAAAVNASGSTWQNGTTVLSCTLTAAGTGETALVPYNAIVSTPDAMDSYTASADEIKIVVAAPDDGDGDDQSGDDGSGTDTGKDTGTGGGDSTDKGSAGDNTGGSDPGSSGTSDSSGGSSSPGGSGSGANQGADGSAGSAAAAFTDISSHWSRAYVEYVAGKGYFSGVSETSFAPDSYMTRGMLVTVLWRADGSQQQDVSGGTGFSDVASGDWYAQAVSWAAANNIVSGMGDGSFAPKSNITREQMVQIIRNFAAYKGCDVSAAAELAGFSDAEAVSSWASDAVKWGIASGLISGTGESRLAPKGTATRAQVAKVLMTLDQSVLNK